MRPIVLAYTPQDDSTTFFASGVTGVGPFTPTTTSTGDALAHQVTLTSGANLSAITLTVTGTDADGKTQTEAITGPNITTVNGSKYFLTVTSVTASSTLGANTMDIGIKDDAVSKTIPINWKTSPVNIGFAVDITGTIDYTVQHTFEDLYQEGPNNLNIFPAQGTWYNNSSVAAKTVDTDGNYAAPIRAMRLMINSLTAGATVELTILQGAN